MTDTPTAEHGVAETWQEGPRGEFSWRCFCGTHYKHQTHGTFKGPWACKPAVERPEPQPLAERPTALQAQEETSELLARRVVALTRAARAVVEAWDVPLPLGGARARRQNAIDRLAAVLGGER